MDFETHAAALASLFNEGAITWGFGGSCLLYCLGVDVTPRDLDVVVSLKDVERAKAMLESKGARLLEEKPSDNVYLTTKFYTLQWGDIEVDLMANAGICYESVAFRLGFETEGPWGFVKRQNQVLWLSSPYDWLEYYRRMSGREHRVKQLAVICASLSQNKKG